MKATVKPVTIKQRLSRWNLIRFQINTYCILRNIKITNADLDMLALLSLLNTTSLSTFCELLTKTELSTGVRIKKQSGKETEYKYIFNSLQSARNAIARIIELGLIKSQGKGNIKIQISSDIEVHTDLNLLINYQFLCLDTNES